MPTDLQKHQAPKQLGVSPLDDTIGWFKEAVPNVSKTTLGVQMGVHFEEVSEMVEQIAGGNQDAAMLIMQAHTALVNLANSMKADPGLYEVYPEDRQEILDALCDQAVTGAGTAYMLGFDFTAALAEVNRSNYSKFVDGKAIFTEQGKIAKGPDFFRPDLAQFV